MSANFFPYNSWVFFSMLFRFLLTLVDLCCIISLLEKQVCTFTSTLLLLPHLCPSMRLKITASVVTENVALLLCGCCGLLCGLLLVCCVVSVGIVGIIVFIPTRSAELSQLFAGLYRGFYVSIY